jgi:hypothetical protein
LCATTLVCITEKRVDVFSRVDGERRDTRDGGEYQR